jgi:Uma2 family endonuclease
MEKEKLKPYEPPATKPNIIEEPFVMFGTLDLDVSKRYTYADYLTWLDDKRRELIDGFIHFMSGPLRRHGRISIKLSNRMFSFIEKRKGKCEVYHAPFDVRLPLHGSTDDDKIYDVVQPDICVICDLSKLDDKGCIGAPDLIVEVLSPSTLKYDWNYKFNLYEAAGVKEYWIVDPIAKVANVFLLQPDGKYDLGTVYECGKNAPVHILEGLEIDITELFED